jgi:hypothetical protein
MMHRPHLFSISEGWDLFVGLFLGMEEVGLFVGIMLAFGFRPGTGSGKPAHFIENDLTLTKVPPIPGIATKNAMLFLVMGRDATSTKQRVELVVQY